MAARDRGGTVKRAAIGCLAAIGLVVVLMAIGSALDTSRTIDAERAASAARTAIAPDSVILNFRTGRMTIVVRIPRSAVDSTGTAFVWAFFTNPGTTDGSWSDMPIRVKPDFSSGDTAVVRAVRERFGWWKNSAAPRDGYRAHVFVGTDSAAVYQFSLERDKDPALSSPVRSIGR